MSDVIRITWPRSDWSEALTAALAEATGQKIIPAANASDTGRDGHSVVMHMDFLEGVIVAYEAALAAGSRDDTDSFVRFASRTVAPYKQFRTNWLTSDTAATLPRINISHLRNDPSAALGPVLARLDPERFGANAPDTEVVSYLQEAIQPVLDISDPTAFRHHDPELFAQLARLQLPREVVARTFQDMIQRKAKDTELLFLQSMPTIAKVRDALERSVEYTSRHGLPEEDIRLGYRLFLDRQPSVAEMDRMKKNHTELNSVRQVFMRSPEFARKYQAMAGKAAEVTQPSIPGEKQTFASMPRLCSCTETRVVFLHVPKCGGTTLHHMLGQWYGPANMHPERFNGLYRYAAAQLASKRVFSGHFDYYSTTLIPGSQQLISFLRDPMDRLVSLYNFHRAHAPAAIKRGNLQLPRWANEHDIDAYFAHPDIRAHSAVDNSIVRYFSDIPQVSAPMQDPALQNATLDQMLEQALRNLEKFAFIGFMDRYEEDIERLAKTLDRPAPSELRRHQVLDDLMESNPDMRRIKKQRPKPETLDGMEELVRYDRLFYARAREIFS